ncbi:aminotransferase class IV [Dyadobacter sp. CY312]|uniref:aminotransferase class IV n=1 Tax=Dyadobacter sp. CY312 TaxID=2907303 RepID=UPI001F2C1B46|nr:aminotransferase class IV [Dyadobacter sp. CY312]MCE7041976.1 aminotransferase class IV [Dyadobacter sp. CY312]
MPHTLCIETIAVQNRQFKNIEYHEARLNKTRKKLWGYNDYWKLEDLIKIPNEVSNDLHKCRLAYGEEIDNIRWEPYTARTIQKIRIVHHDSVDYSYKYDQREELNDLYAQRGDADEILIIKKGMVTDSFYCNVAFLDGEKWYTPKTYLLPGTQRALLLDSGVIREAEVSENDIQKFSHIKLFNAMVGWDLAPMLPIGMVD